MLLQQKQQQLLALQAEVQLLMIEGQQLDSTIAEIEASVGNLSLVLSQNKLSLRKG